MKRVTSRRNLLKNFERPAETLKFEIWPNGHCLFFINEEGDYYEFPSLNDALTFYNLNYE